jgi:hypothetical protein
VTLVDDDEIPRHLGAIDEGLNRGDLDRQLRLEAVVLALNDSVIDAFGVEPLAGLIHQLDAIREEQDPLALAHRGFGHRCGDESFPTSGRQLQYLTTHTSADVRAQALDGAL